MLTPEEVKKIAVLARIELSDAEIAKYGKDLDAVLDYVAELQQVNTDGLEIVSQVTGLENVMRLDAPELNEIQQEIMANAPAIKDGYYKVKAIL